MDTVALLQLKYAVDDHATSSLPIAFASDVISSADVMSSMLFLHQRLQMQQNYQQQQQQQEAQPDQLDMNVNSLQATDESRPRSSHQTSSSLTMTTASASTTATVGTSTPVPDETLNAGDDDAVSTPDRDFEAYLNGSCDTDDGNCGGSGAVGGGLLDNLAGGRSSSVAEDGCFTPLQSVSSLNDSNQPSCQLRLDTLQSAYGLLNNNERDFSAAISSSTSTDEQPYLHHRYRQTQQQLQLQQQEPKQSGDQRPMTLDSPTAAPFDNQCNRTVAAHKSRSGNTFVARGGSTGRLSSSSFNRAPGGVRMYHCRMCRKEFESKTAMQRHAKERHRADEKNHKCSVCLKSFPTSQQLMQHNLVHNNVRKYPCHYCDKTFKQLSHVQQHQRIHTGDRPYRCIVETCSKAFRQLSSLQQHLKGHNLPATRAYGLANLSSVDAMPTTAERPNDMTDNEDVKVSITALARPTDLTCQVCEEQCADEERFFHHIHRNHADYWRVFAGGRPLADFIHTVKRVNRYASGTGNGTRGHQIGRRERKYMCQECGKTFVQESSYAKHVAGHRATSGAEGYESGRSVGENVSGVTSTYRYTTSNTNGNSGHGKEYRYSSHVGSPASLSGGSGPILSVDRRRRLSVPVTEVAEMTGAYGASDEKKTVKMFRHVSLSGEAVTNNIAWMSMATSSNYGTGSGEPMLQSPLPGSLKFSLGEKCDGNVKVDSPGATSLSGTVCHNFAGSTAGTRSVGDGCHQTSPRSNSEPGSPSSTAIGPMFSTASSSRFRSSSLVDGNTAPFLFYRKIASSFDDASAGPYHYGHRYSQQHYQQQQQSLQHHNSFGDNEGLHSNSTCLGLQLSPTTCTSFSQPAYISLDEGQADGTAMTDYQSSTTDPSPFSTAAAAAAAAVSAARQSQQLHKQHQKHTYAESLFYRQLHSAATMTSSTGSGNGYATSSSNNSTSASANRFFQSGSLSSLSSTATPTDHRINSIRGYVSTSTSPPVSGAYLGSSSSPSPTLSLSDVISGGHHYGQTTAAQRPFDASPLSPTLGGSSSFFDAGSSALVGPFNSYLYHTRHHYLTNPYNGSHTPHQLDYSQYHQHRFGSKVGTSGSFSGHDVAVASALLARPLPVFR